jgi:ubiquitin thioesterase protein OTUB1
MTSNPAPSTDLEDKKLGDLTDAEIAQLTANLNEEQANERPLLCETEPL